MVNRIVAIIAYEYAKAKMSVIRCIYISVFSSTL
jgi:hypothetical protein